MRDLIVRFDEGDKLTDNEIMILKHRLDNAIEHVTLLGVTYKCILGGLYNKLHSVRSIAEARGLV